ncbi:hypothetical protein M758_10G092000 [Ceratodon purpureus]|uniref:Uncharacterized protein n=1 Tax=Ceratodon purpureus TaxID=3225 RepID=A0A8T0GL46_CERPU|nr:hypothetical protein KC19_10G093500 [Ceratodon purpureus]KAG0603411.1 hypothetical protein M758_10G092000 [Ceratodon purpureus]
MKDWSFESSLVFDLGLCLASCFLRRGVEGEIVRAGRTGRRHRGQGSQWQ